MATGPFQPYADRFTSPNGPGDARPTAMEIVKDSDMFGKLSGKVALITGCSSGIGVETARALHATGAKLYLTVRDVEKGKKVVEDVLSKDEDGKGVPIELLELHLDSLAEVRKSAEEFKKRESQLNILINNAGVMACPYGKTKDGFETQIGSNHMAHFLLFQELKPLLLASSTPSFNSRVINVSSAGHGMGKVNFDDINYEHSEYSKFQAYGQSKTANIYMANAIDRNYGAQGLHGLSLHPGVIMTELGRHLTPEDYARFGDRDAFMKFLRSPEQGAATTVWCAVSPYWEGKGGKYCSDVGDSAPMAEGTVPGAAGYAPHAYNEEAEEKLWKLSCKAVGVF